ncbi:MAG TPA: VCBS repeat-containing protein [Polyangiales bacterium]|nr:VCBS repeat-containing protein [Polyangiales bacterium]
MSARVTCVFLAGLALACSKEEPKPEATPAPPAPVVQEAPKPEQTVLPRQGKAPKWALALALSRFEGAKPQPARLELVAQRDGTWSSVSFDDPDSNVFHKGLGMQYQGETPRIVTLGGMKAAIKSWSSKAEGFQSSTLWTEDFGGKFSRMRDAEMGDIDGDGRVDIAVGTHDQGIVAYLKRVLTPDGKPSDKWDVVKLDKIPNTFIHEIELGDLDKDGALEIYATPSEPNKLDAGEQSGQVVRYVPKLKQGRKVVADLGKRHAKEILVKDVDGDGTDELYVAVEALTKGDRDNVEIVEPVEIRRYDAKTAPTGGKVVARIQDRYCRFLTSGDIDGDGKKEMVAAAFRSGVWLLRPGADASQEWTIENIDTDSSGFEHAALLTDLDGDGTDELYVAADDQGELRRYVWKDGKPVRETILKRDNPRETWTWNITSVFGELTGL